MVFGASTGTSTALGERQTTPSALVRLYGRVLNRTAIQATRPCFTWLLLLLDWLSRADGDFEVRVGFAVAPFPTAGLTN